MYALVDCNNFYASCERVFRPALRQQPIVVLSNNDGCVIARSEEAKDLGIGMGVPYFKITFLCRQHKVHVFSSNYVLYGDLSHRVMSIIQEEWPQMSQYSIDEAFLDLRQMPSHLHDSFCERLQRLILRSTGIPTSIGIGPTQTLAKLANHVSKKKLKIPVFNITQQRIWLTRMPIGEVWGIGLQAQKKLASHRIYTAADLAALCPLELKRHFHLPLVQIGLELQGISVHVREENTARHSIVSSRSFGQMQSDLQPLIQAISKHARATYDKLRQQHSCVKQLSVFVLTNRFRDDLPQYRNQMMHTFIYPTDDLRLITQAAIHCLKHIYKPELQYKKVGVCMNGLIRHDQVQPDMLDQPSEEELEKRRDVMAVLDNINHKFGRDTLKLASEGFDHVYAMRSNMRSPHYTTQWSDIITVKNGT